MPQMYCAKCEPEDVQVVYWSNTLAREYRSVPRQWSDECAGVVGDICRLSCGDFEMLSDVFRDNQQCFLLCHALMACEVSNRLEGPHNCQGLPENTKSWQ